ncbi:MAG TPA: M1 family metallopeptidase [Cytophagaceae bacterium]|jgi:aminopeptidase N
MNRILFLYLLTFVASASFAQKSIFTRHDSLRGGDNEMRNCYDVHFYDLKLTFDIGTQSISGSNKIYFESIRNINKIQIDLFTQLTIDSITRGREKLVFVRDSNATLIDMKVEKGRKSMIEVFYHGKPKQALNAPWDGGFVWTKDSLGKNWVGVACEGIGASLWWPNKDLLSDEPDSVRCTFEVPSEYFCVSNGALTNTINKGNGFTSYEWRTHSSINNYNVTVNIGDYAHIKDEYKRTNGQALALDYYVLKYNEDTARKHFEQVKRMLTCYEKLFGEYPFSKDGYALVETPYWGMEHQGAIAYGNKYKNDILDLDYIIVHESAHEWWGNSVSAGDHAEMWIHESFATYAEALLLECLHGKEVANMYLIYQRESILNKEPILGPLGVNYNNWEGSDMYYKGSWMLQTLRNVVNNDPLWYETIYNFHEKNKHKILNTEEVISFFEKSTQQTLKHIFYQYLKSVEIPTFSYSLQRKGRQTILSYKWEGTTAGFSMPVEVFFEGTAYRLTATTGSQTISLPGKSIKSFSVNTDLFYVNVKNVK